MSLSLLTSLPHLARHDNGMHYAMGFADTALRWEAT